MSVISRISKSNQNISSALYKLSEIAIRLENVGMDKVAYEIRGLVFEIDKELKEINDCIESRADKAYKETVQEMAEVIRNLMEFNKDKD